MRNDYAFITIFSALFVNLSAAWFLAIPLASDGTTLTHRIMISIMYLGLAYALEQLRTL